VNKDINTRVSLTESTSIFPVKFIRILVNLL